MYDVMLRRLEYVDGHYQQSRLRRNDAVELPICREVALKRLEGLKRRLKGNPSLREKYIEQMANIIKSGHAEIVSDSPCSSKKT